jgi:glycosyltransferase involved in cell wall biosynthesis
MPTLLHHLSRMPHIHVDVAAAHRGSSDGQVAVDGVNYFVIGQPRYQSYFSCTKKDLEKCLAIIRQTEPDVIHIHGTERFYGLIAARKLTRTPCVISLQGLLGPYVTSFFGALTARDLRRSERLLDLLTRRSLFWMYRDYCAGARREREVLAGANALMGRTEWDRAHLKSVNPRAKYYHVGEILRDDFRAKSWDIAGCRRHSILFTNVGEPRRGIEILLRAMLSIRRDFPDVQLRLAGEIGNRRGYHRFVRRMIAESGLTPNVELLGYLDARALVRELSGAHVFAIPSYIENSPNSLCEAMQVGVPCVATYAGGIPSLIQHHHTGLLYPREDAPLLAEAIMKIFRDDDLACRLGRSGRVEALERHAPERVLSQLLNAYQEVAANGRFVRLTQPAVAV